MKDTDLRSPDASNVLNPAGKNKAYTYWVKIDSHFFVPTQIVLEKYKKVFCSKFVPFSNIMFALPISVGFYMAIYICMFHPDVQPSWLINSPV